MSAPSGPPPSKPSDVSSLPFDVNSPDIYYDQVAGAWRKEKPGGTAGEELQFDERISKWVEVIDDEELVKRQQAAYSVQGVDEEEPAAPVARRINKKRKADDNGEASSSTTSGPSSSNKAARQAPSKERVTTSVFVSGLPLDTTVQELAEVFGRYGVLNEDDTGAPRIKLYYAPAPGSEDKVFKGEALVTYFRPESVGLAVRLLDESCLRAHLGQREPLMRVQEAQFGSAGAGTKEGGNGKDEDGTAQASKAEAKGSAPTEQKEAQAQQQPPKGRKPMTEQEKRKAAKRQARMQSKLTGWDSDEEDGFGPISGPNLPSSSASYTTPSSSSAGPATASAKARIVILRRMFTLAELDEDPKLLLELKEDVRDECQDFGKVTNCVLYDKEPDGIMSVKFQDPLAARACVAKMDGRFFAGRRVIAYLVDGRPKFRRSGVGEAEEDDDAEEGGGDGEEEKRMDSFGSWLEAGGDAE